MERERFSRAVAGCKYVHHIASPFPFDSPRDPQELIRPAVDGTRRVLGACVEAGVKRVVMTSSIAAISSERARYTYVRNVTSLFSSRRYCRKCGKATRSRLHAGRLDGSGVSAMSHVRSEQNARREGSTEICCGIRRGVLQNLNMKIKIIFYV